MPSPSNNTEEKLFWISYAFADEFVGVVILPAEDSDEAERIARARGLIPRPKEGETRKLQALVIRLPDYARATVLHDSDIGVLLSRERAEAINERGRQIENPVKSKQS